MRKVYRSFLSFLMAVAVFLLSSCTTMSLMSATNKYFDAYKNGETDLTNYADYQLKECKFPDGKIVTAYVFNSNAEALLWQRLQQKKYYSDAWKQQQNKIYEEYMKKAEEEERSNSYYKVYSIGDYRTTYGFSYKWYPTGPLSPFFQAAKTMADNYGGMEKVNEMLVKNNPVSYYDKNDLGSLSDIMTKDSAAYACYEDSVGTYFLFISKPEYQDARLVSEEMKKFHKDEFAYQIEFIPKEFYKVPTVKLNPAKTTPYNPDSVPDSKRNLTPDISSGSSAYYYDKTLAYNLQWLAVEVACKGKYDMAYTGDFYTKNPTDYYTTSYIKQYLAKSGEYTRGTTLFEGICFDYADWAYQDVASNKKNFNVTDVWMVGTFNDSSNIIAYRIAQNGETPNYQINGTPVIVAAQYHIAAHENAKYHAWLWVRGTDGVFYWVDPTWTDNSGRPVYGIVRGGKEIELAPSSELCVK